MPELPCAFFKITHEDDLCDKGRTDDPTSLLRAQRAASVTQKRRTMYVGGYASKKKTCRKARLDGVIQNLE